MLKSILRYFGIVLTNVLFIFLAVGLALLVVLGVAQLVMDNVFPWSPGDPWVQNVFTQPNFFAKFTHLWVFFGILFSMIPAWCPESFWVLTAEKFK